MADLWSKAGQKLLKNGEHVVVKKPEVKKNKEEAKENGAKHKSKEEEKVKVSKTRLSLCVDGKKKEEKEPRRLV